MGGRVLVVVAVVLAGMGWQPAGRAWAGEKGPGPLPKDLVAAWQKAGAEPGWMASGFSLFPTFRAGGAGRAGELPAFRFRAWKAGVLGKLPRPEQAFGLDLSETKVSDAGLRELTALRQLRTLSLGGTKVAGAGLQELAALKQLQTLSLGGTKVSDAGLKGLTTLQQLQRLDLSHTPVTDAGLKELAKLQKLRTLYLSRPEVTDAGVAALRKALPGCAVLR